MRICALGSGSSGNALLVEGPRGVFLVDAGLPWREIESRAVQAGLSLAGLEWVVLTHEHTDHVRGLDRLRRRGVRVAASAGTLRALAIEGTVLEPGMEIAGVRVFAFPIPHDARQPVGFRFEANGTRMGIATDLGRITDDVLTALTPCQTVVLEANHDVSMLLSGPYPWPLKLRILGPDGHLANEETGRAVRRLGSELRQVLLAHLSDENNTPALALETVAQAVDGWRGRLYLTYPDRPSVVVGA
ncbi:MAG: Zn-dependent hydrolase YycJ/WalJ, required for cell wall metabolism and coordination of cell division with DNA replication [Candidatus Bipolaricaulis sibiricus]|uniref:Zn-dependent hydrolase YycJ/WalJ, required for cell wall metabolism and coordination of cell division with DNA replication n=1 Tax=Bipolaricaulis sibiricus TaxID=2501609 RepID=A0A410FVH1_BIPS1|nr:MAG: Zn-dependent hydrolase YycJ/WalJ, required for cell wall metabolism and coordination of cell division with DNA replication [Candidatus Bipolaricaulis sibiricus]